MTMRLAAMIVMVGLCGEALSADQTPATDLTLQQAIEQRLEDHSVRGVVVSVDGNVVTLKGCVATLREKNTAREDAWMIHHAGPVLDDVTVASTCSDDQLAARISQQIRHFVFFSIFDDVEVAVADGIVRLTGTVTHLHKIEEFVAMVSKIPGVRGVEDAVRWLPATRADKELRQRVAGRVYGDRQFLHYAVAPYAPIHFLVTDGQVVLTGVVGSDDEKRAAEDIVRETVGVRSCDNRLRIGDEAAASRPAP